MHKWIVLSAVPVVAAIALLAHPPPADACEPAPPFETENISGDQPSCMKVTTSGGSRTDIVGVENQCSESVTLEVLECEGATCGDERIEVPPGETDGISDDEMGLNGDDFEDGETFTATFAWIRGESDEGVVEADVTYTDTSGACGCGCNSNSVEDGPPAGGGLAALLAAAIVIVRRRD